MAFADDFRTHLTATMQVQSAACQAGDYHGESNRLLRRMIAEVREALNEMDDLADSDLQPTVVMMRRLIRESIARAREGLKPMDEAARLEIDEYRREKERLQGKPERGADDEHDS
jgi:hypothetical protein